MKYKPGDLVKVVDSYQDAAIGLFGEIISEANYGIFVHVWLPEINKTYWLYNDQVAPANENNNKNR